MRAFKKSAFDRTFLINHLSPRWFHIRGRSRRGEVLDALEAEDFAPAEPRTRTGGVTARRWGTNQDGPFRSG
jgi:hypothetical protein